MVYTPNQIKLIKDLDIFDSIWINDDDKIYSGFVMGIDKNLVSVTYRTSYDYLDDVTFKDAIFNITRDLLKTSTTENNITLYTYDPRE